MNRKLVIIGNTGAKDHYVDSVNYDIENYKRYFLSANGGAWNSETEILSPHVNTFSWNDLDIHMRVCEMTEHVDIWVIVFTGHGWADVNDTYLEPKPGTSPEQDIPISWIKNMTRGSRCLLIADSCRSVLPIVEGIETRERTFSFSDGDTDAYREACRRLYDNTLSDVPVGTFCAGYACAFKQTAGNVFGDRGGLYSDALIKTAAAEIHDIRDNNSNEHVISFSYIHSVARRIVIDATQGAQVPEIEHNRARQIPFCVIP